MINQNFAQSRTITTLCLLVFAISMLASRDTTSAGSAQTGTATDVPLRRVNVPYTGALEDISVTEQAIVWFGETDAATKNYTDVRAIYNDEKLFITFHVFDDLLWYNHDPTHEELTEWDAVTLYLKTGEGSSLGADSYRLVSQLSPMWEARDAHEAVYVGENGSWTLSPLEFETNIGTQMNGINDDQLDGGWNFTFHIPFESLGLDGPPPRGTTWGLALVTHDRDASATTFPTQDQWPEWSNGQDPSTWGELVFGLPTFQQYVPAKVEETTMIREGSNGHHVVDSHVGGGMICGADLAPDIRERWGSYNRGGSQGVNIQNQWNLWDRPCFSKYYVTFPLESPPPGKVIVSATLTVVQFGNANAFGEYPDHPAQPSLIQVFTVGENWEEFTLTWNNAPLAIENITRSWVDPLPIGSSTPEPRHWDVRIAVANAYRAGERQLRLALYSADDKLHSGKYFRTSEFYDPALRPTLRIQWGHPITVSHQSFVPLVAR